MASISKLSQTPSRSNHIFTGYGKTLTKDPPSSGIKPITTTMEPSHVITFKQTIVSECHNESFHYCHIYQYRQRRAAWSRDGRGRNNDIDIL
jgi:hypothetical protein